MRAEGRLPEPKLPERAARAVEAVAELDVFFAPSAKHVHDRKEWVAVAKIDDYESGAGPIDLDGESPVQLRAPRT